ncbi:ThiF family adenylyltransferase [Kribbella sp. NPDC005582]|uniref:ThiF family adenylyltransferase n=1 Tax=Kribbella sp. NPDC005582 TaxID=3156893 RepID=UPI0033A6E1AD
MDDRYDRQIRLFGAEGQSFIENAHVVVLGCGGIGMPVIQQLGYLGVRHWTLVDDDAIDVTTLNRLVGAVPEDVGTVKMEVATRLIRGLHPSAIVDAIDGRVGDPKIVHQLTEALSRADLVIGCFDRETPRLFTTKLCSDVGVPYIDAATDVVEDDDELMYGGRVITAHDGTGCVACLGVLDQVELAREKMTPVQREEHDRIYGVDRGDLDGSGPSVVMLNGVVASLACTEAMVLLTGLRVPNRQLTYRAHLGGVGRDMSRGDPACVYCSQWRQHRTSSDLSKNSEAS